MFESFFIFKLGSAAWQALHLETKINNFSAIFSYAENINSGALENQGPFFLIIFHYVFRFYFSAKEA